MDVIARGIKNAFRNVVRTLSLVVILGLSIGLSLAMLIAHQAVGQKIDSVKASVGNTITISPAGVRGFEGGGNPLTDAQLAGVKKLAHVTAVDESLNDRLTTNDTSLQSAIDAGTLGRRFAGNSGQTFVFNGGSGRFGGDGSVNTVFTPPISVIGTTNPTNLSGSFGGGTFTLKSGKIFSSTDTGNVALIGSSLAAKNNLQAGSTFTAYGQTVTVDGIFDAGNTFSNNQVIMPLAAVQNLSGQSGDITSATATVDSIGNVASVTTAIQKALGSAADVTNAADRANQTIQPLENIQTISLYSLIGAVAAGAIIILMTMIMIVRERRREIGVIKAIGASNLRVMAQFMVEAITLTLLGAIVGIGLGVVAGNPITQLLVTNSASSSSPSIGGGNFATRFGNGAGLAFRGLRGSLQNITAVVGWDIVLYGLAAAVIIAILGSALASFFIAKIRPAEVLRTE
ncbi:MAG TPA: FtsX-like permease family protein [Candidatus Acidoferrum sp.]|nr:FtsX-like permease family protein [Candidatus Acidoferrum sp.]